MREPRPAFGGRRRRDNARSARPANSNISRRGALTLTGRGKRCMRKNTDVAVAPLLAASIFLDILNVFLFFLQIFSGGER
jgi:hypothetical protein